MNEVEKNLQISKLLDYYGEMLTEKQRGFIDLYYNEDFSLAEIAEHENITRQGVRDSIKHGEQILCELESKLHLAEKSETYYALVQRVGTLAAEIHRGLPIQNRREGGDWFRRAGNTPKPGLLPA